MTIKIPVSADFDGSDVEKQIAKLNEQMNRLAQTVAQANKVKFTPVGAGSLGELKAIEDRFKELTRLSGALRERIKVTGQGGSTFGAVDWGRLYEDPAMRAKKMQQAFQHVTAGTRYAVPFGAPPAAPPGAPGTPSTPTPPGGQPPAPHIPGFGPNGIVGAGLRATGPVGGVVANAAGAGMSGGLGAGIFGLLGGLAALAVGKGVAAVKDKVDAAGQEGVGYDTLKRTLGDVNVSFNLLRETLRAASDNIDVTFEEAQKLGTDFAKLSGISKEQYKTLADEVSVGGGFGRSFGVDPAQSNQFFGQMRGFGVTQNTNDSRRLALMIGEAVGKSGSFSKVDEVLQAIASFTATQTRSGLVGANVAGYAGSLSGMLASRTPGLDPQGAAALLGRVNSSIAAGGAAGEAGQNYLFSTLGRKHGLDPVQAAMLQQQGAFGTGRMAFGQGSLFSKFSARFGGGVSGSASNSDETNLTAILARTQKDYGKSPSLMLNATARLLGINENQAMALHTVDPQKLGGMTGRMGRLGLDMGQLSSTGISALSNIESGDRATLMGQANALRKHRNSLSTDELTRLKTAEDSGDTGKLKDVLTELTYAREQESTEGSKTRESIQSVDKRIQELATHLVGPMNDMRNALVFMAGGGKKGVTGIAEGVMRAESAERLENLGARHNANIDEQRGIVVGASNEMNAARSDWSKRAPKMSPQEFASEGEKFKAKMAELELKRKNAESRILELQVEIGRAMSDEKRKLEADVKQLRVDSVAGSGSTSNKKAFEEKYGAAAARAGAALGVDKKLVLAQWGVETGWGKSIVPGTNNLGNIKDVSGGGVAATDNLTGKMDKYRAFKNTDAFADHYVGLLKRKYPGAVGAGADGQKFMKGLNGYAEDPAYAPKVIDSSRNLFSTPMPTGAEQRAKEPPEQKLVVEGNFTLQTPGGARAAEPIVVKKTVSAPRPSGL